MASLPIRRYWYQVTARGCAVHGPDCAAEVAHVAGRPSIVARTKEPKAKGKKLARLDWLVIPLCPYLHRWAPDALDMNPRLFESRYGSVADMIDRQAAALGVDIWTLSQRGRK